MTKAIDWSWLRFGELSTDDVYAILCVRQEVFVVEQQCRYQDADGKDYAALHLCGWLHLDTGRELVAYLRVLSPGVRYPETSIGRVLTTSQVRGQGLGKDLITKGIDYARQQFPETAIRISAQAYLQRFYEGFGFIAEGDPYDEEGIEHIQMLLPAAGTVID